MLSQAVDRLRGFGLNANIVIPSNPFIRVLVNLEIHDDNNQSNEMELAVMPMKDGWPLELQRLHEDEGWHTLIVGPGMSRTIIALHENIDYVVSALIGFCSMEKLTNISLKLIQRCIWEIHKGGLWCEVNSEGKLEIYQTNIPRNFYPDLFMVESFGHLDLTRKMVISVSQHNWTLEVWKNDEIVERSLIQTSEPIDIANQVLKDWAGKE